MKQIEWSSLSSEVYAKARNVTLLLLDVDGVLTDGGLYYFSDGTDGKRFNVLDGLAVYMLSQLKFPVMIITAKGSKAVARRAKEMQVVRLYEDIRDKGSLIATIAQEQGITPEQMCFVGDDLLDLSAMQSVGFPVAVANAIEEIKNIAVYTTVNAGGRGAVRETIELILRAQGLWEKAIALYR